MGTKTGLKVKLIGKDGNGFAIIGECRKVLRQNGHSAEEREAFMKEAMSGDYDHLLATVMDWFEVE